MQGDVQSAIKHLYSVAQLHQWSNELNVPNDPSILRVLADLGDTDTFLLLQLQGINNIQTFSKLENANGITTNQLVKEKLLDTAQVYKIECSNDVSDLNKLMSHIQNRIIFVSLF